MNCSYSDEYLSIPFQWLMVHLESCSLSPTLIPDANRNPWLEAPPVNNPRLKMEGHHESALADVPMQVPSEAEEVEGSKYGVVMRISELVVTRHKSMVAGLSARALEMSGNEAKWFHLAQRGETYHLPRIPRLHFGHLERK